MIVERVSHPQFLSNTYLVSDGAGGPAFFVDAGGPVEPLIVAALYDIIAALRALQDAQAEMRAVPAGRNDRS